MSFATEFGFDVEGVSAVEVYLVVLRSPSEDVLPAAGVQLEGAISCVRIGWVSSDPARG